jgi:hypothetical protein
MCVATNVYACLRDFRKLECWHLLTASIIPVKRLWGREYDGPRITQEPAYLFKIQRIQREKATERREGTQGQKRRTAERHAVKKAQIHQGILTPRFIQESTRDQSAENLSSALSYKSITETDLFCGG